jgi:Ca2+-binding RTX toxin-like protein
VILAGGGNDTIFGDNSVDFATSYGAPGGKDLLDGGDVIDTIKAGPGNDFLNGGSGSPDDCDGESGIDAAVNCEILIGVP